MLEALRRICYEGGCLVGVEYALFEGSDNFVTAIALHFQGFSAVFKAVEEDDTLSVTVGPLIPELNDIVKSATDSECWPRCIGLSVQWAWLLTNQQGYSDGVRLEFHSPKERTCIVEMIVSASAIRLCSLTSEHTPGSRSPN